jgi:hypothetical protein
VVERIAMGLSAMGFVFVVILSVPFYSICVF